MADYATFFSEQAPGTWVEGTDRWNASTAEVEQTRFDPRPRLKLTGGTEYSLQSWDVLDSDADRDDVEALLLMSVSAKSSDVEFGYILPFFAARASGSAGAETGYLWALDENPRRVRLYRFSAGAATSISNYDISSARVFELGEPFWFRLYCSGSDLKYKWWLKDDDEPSWYRENTDSVITAAGWCGPCSRHTGSSIDFHYMAVSTGVSSSPSALAWGPNSPRGAGSHASWFGRPFDELLSTGSEIELRARIATQDLDTSTAVDLWATEEGRGFGTGPGDLPVSTAMRPLLIDPGLPELSIVGDREFDQAGADRLQLRLRNKPTEADGAGILDYLIDDSLSGRQVQLYAGDPGHSQRSFLPIWSGVQVAEPSLGSIITIEAAKGEFVDDDGEPRATGRFERPLDVRRYAGVPRCLAQVGTASTGRVLFSNVSAYDGLTSQTRFIRYLIPSGGVETRFCLHQNSSTDRNCWWRIGTGGTMNWYFTSGGVDDLSLSYATDTEDGELHWASIAFFSGVRAEMMIDGVVVAETTTVNDPDAATGADISMMALANTDGVKLCDFRVVNRYMTPEEVRASASEALTDLNNNGTVPSDHILYATLSETSGSSVTDSSATANNGAMNGVEGTDYDWVTSGLGEFEQAGQVMPRTDGEVLHMAPDLVDTQFEGGTGWAMRFTDRAAADGLTAIADHTMYGAGVEYNDIAIPGDGLVTTDAALTEPATLKRVLDTVSSEPVEIYPAGLVQTVATETGGFAATDIDTESITRCKSLMPWRSGYHFQREMSLRQFLEAVVTESGGHYGLDRHGRLWLDRLLVPGVFTPSTDTTLGPIGTCTQYYVAPFVNSTPQMIEAHGQTQPVLSFGNVSDLTGDVTMSCYFRADLGGPVDIGSPAGSGLPTGPKLIEHGHTLGINIETGKVYFGGVGLASGGDDFVEFQGAGEHALNGNWWIAVGEYDVSAAVRYLTLFQIVSDTEWRRYTPEGQTGITGTLTTRTDTLHVGGGKGDIGFAGHLWRASTEEVYRSIGVFCSSSVINADSDTTSITTGCFVPMVEGRGEAAELVSGAKSVLTGARWSPALEIDLTPSTRRPQTAEWAPSDGPRSARPARKIVVNFGTNFAPIPKANLAGAVSTNDALEFSRESVSSKISLENETVDRLDAREVVVDSPLSLRVGADSLAKALRRRYGADMLLAVLQGIPRSLAARVEPGDVVRVIDPRYGMADGHAFRVLARSRGNGQDASGEPLFSLSLWG